MFVIIFVVVIVFIINLGMRKRARVEDGDGSFVVPLGGGTRCLSVKWDFGDYPKPNIGTEFYIEGSLMAADNGTKTHLFLMACR